MRSDERTVKNITVPVPIRNAADSRPVPRKTFDQKPAEQSVAILYLADRHRPFALETNFMGAASVTFHST